MAAQRLSPYVTLETYLAWEDKAETKSEYYDGTIVAMSGGSRSHVRLTTNVSRLLGNHLEGGPCESFDSDLRVYVEARRSMFYPDFTVACDPPQFTSSGMATLTNPTVIIEVLSPSTTRLDRGFKSDCYRSLASLKAYVLVAQDEPRIEAFVRQSDDTWRYDVASGLDSVLRLDCLQYELRLAQIYARVEFPALPIIASKANNRLGEDTASNDG